MRFPWSFGRSRQNLHRYDAIELETTNQNSESKGLGLRLRDPGWRTGALWGALLTSTIIVTNLIILIVGAAKPKNGSGYRVFFEGDCSKSRTISTVWHLVINVLSTLLLAASNACTQILSAPSRIEVDRAHSQGKSLHVGVLGFLNLSFIPARRSVLILLLALSSIPLHFFYNSVIYDSVGAYEYLATVVSPDFVVGAPWHLASDQNYGDIATTVVQALQDRARNNTLVRLSKKECISQFRDPLVSNCTSALLVSTTLNRTNSVQGKFAGTFVRETSRNPLSVGSATDWVCNTVPDARDPKGGPCLTSEVDQSTVWTVNDFTIDYCLGAQAPSHCTVNFDWQLMVIVLACNAFKLGCFACTLAMKHSPLITIGDAVASFLSHPDCTTADCSPFTVMDIRKGLWRPSTQSNITAAKRHSIGIAVKRSKWRQITNRNEFFFRSGSQYRWVLTNLYYFSLLIIATVLLSINLGYEQGFSWTLGQSSQNRYSKVLIGSVSGPLLANLPQVILSSAYVLYNAIFTCMLLSHEYCRYAIRSQPLRVTNKAGQQKSTYWLSVPFIWAIPIMTAMAVLHWLVSESLFVVSVSGYDVLGNPKPSANELSLGWGIASTAISVMLGAVMVLFLIANGFRRFPAGIPLASSSSVAISAACHRASDEGEDMTLVPIQYGFRKLEETSSEKNSTSFYIGFSSKPVERLTTDEVSALYEGESEHSNSARKGSSNVDKMDAHSQRKLKKQLYQPLFVTDHSEDLQLPKRQAEQLQYKKGQVGRPQASWDNPRLL